MMGWHDDKLVQRVAPFVTLAIVTFLSFPTQWLFSRIEPGALDRAQSFKFNLSIACLYICYLRAWLSDVGRVPKDWHLDSNKKAVDTNTKHLRWCRKCEHYKPPRAHHCKECRQ